MAVLKGHTDYINSIAYEPEKGDLILSASDDQTGKLWDLETGQAVHTFHLASPGTIAPPECGGRGGGGISSCSLCFAESGNISVRDLPSF
jgi:WD40 repeat protein